MDEEWLNVYNEDVSQLFEEAWENVLQYEFAPWQRELAEYCYKIAFLDGAIFGTKEARDSLDEEQDNAG